MGYFTALFWWVPPTLYVAVWIVAFVFAMRMMRREAGRIERFFLAGVSLMLVNSVLVALAKFLQPWLVVWLAQIENTPGPTTVPPLFLGIEILRGCIFVAGIICLVYAFWQKFKTKPTPT